MYDYFTVGVPENNRNKIKITFVIMFAFIISIFCFGLLASRKFEFVPNSSYPIEATKYIKENIGNDKKIFNMYNWGSYLMLNDVKVFIDSRADLYTKEYNNVDVADDYAKITKCLDDYDPILEKYDIEYLLLDKECSVTKFLKNDKTYDIIYEDDICYIFKRNM